MNEKRMVVTDTTDTFSTWTSKDFIPVTLRPELERCQVLLVPEVGFRDYDKPLFPVGTESLLAAMKHALEPSVAVDICIADNDYAELALHSDTWRMGRFVVTFVVLPLVLNVMANYIYDRLKTEPEDKAVSFTLTVVSTNGPSKQISYDGPAKDFPMIAKDIKALWKLQ